MPGVHGLIYYYKIDDYRHLSYNGLYCQRKVKNYPQAIL